MVSKVTAGVGGAVAVTAATLVVRKVLQETGLRSEDVAEDAARWRVVTVDLPPDDVGVPEPLAAWGDSIEVRTTPAPGDRGTELWARLRDPSSVTPPEGLDGETPVQQLRSALRRAKQLLETGEVLRNAGTGEPTTLNAPLRAAEDASGGVGRL